jgi:hypothetical protein
MHARLDFLQHLLDPSSLALLWRPCTPRLLVVTDRLNFATTSAFGLSQFVSTLATSTVHGMTPEVVTASRNGTVGATLPGAFRLDDPARGVLRSRYDVVFLLGVDPEGASPVTAGERAAVARFMDAGGGAFATGDHASLGASLCGGIPRVRAMRHWLEGETPGASDPTRLTTSLPGDDGVYAGGRQSDRRPQRLFVSYRTRAGGVGAPHPLLQGGPLGPIEVFPDHPHEGECRIPEDLATTFELDGSLRPEWPAATGASARVAPERVAITVSHGNSFDGEPTLGGKHAVEPRAFLAIAAYDGELAGVGRVATDATWHHFVNMNLDGTGAPPGLYGLQDPPGTDTPDLLRVRQYYRNLASWLLPKDVRRRLRFLRIFLELERYPLFEELVVPRLETASGDALASVGRQLVASLAHHRPKFEAEELLSDALDDAIGRSERARLADLGDRFSRLSSRNLAFAALGGLTVAAIEKLPALGTRPDFDPHATFENVSTEGPAFGVRRYVEGARKDLANLDDLLHKLDP